MVIAPRWWIEERDVAPRQTQPRAPEDANAQMPEHSSKTVKQHHVTRPAINTFTVTSPPRPVLR